MARRWANAYHDWLIAGVLQARINTRPRAEGYPRTHVKRIGGWRSNPDHDEATQDKPTGRIGEVPHARTSRGRTLAYELQQQADSEPTLVSSLEDLNEAFADESVLGLLLVTPWPGHGDDVWATYAQVLDYDDDGQLVYQPDAFPSPWKSDPLLSLRQIDGRWYWWNESGTLGTPMVFTDGDDAVLVTNSGNAPSDPIITVAGVASTDDIHIGRDAGGGDIGRDLWFRGLPAGTLVVDFNDRSATVGSTDVTDKLDEVESDWWDAGVVGIPKASTVNVWRGPGAGGALSVSCFSASW